MRLGVINSRACDRSAAYCGYGLVLCDVACLRDRRAEVPVREEVFPGARVDRRAIVKRVVGFARLLREIREAFISRE